jgi:transposase-like protein
MNQRRRVNSPIPLPDLRGPEHAEFAAAFWAHVDRSGGPDACWPWTGDRAHGRSRYRLFDYGRCEFRGRRNVRAHRLAYALTKGEVPRHALVLHSCDNPPCQNPRHLHLGDQVRNMGESAVRERTGMRRFTPAQVDEMRRLRAEEGLTYPEIADRFGASIGGVLGLVVENQRYSRYLPTSIRPRQPARTPIWERISLDLADLLLRSGWSVKAAADLLGVGASSLRYALLRAKGQGRTSTRPTHAMSVHLAVLVADDAPTTPLIGAPPGHAAEGLLEPFFDHPDGSAGGIASVGFGPVQAMLAEERSPDGRVKLTDNEITALRDCYRRGEPVVSIAERFGVTPSHVSAVSSGTKRRGAHGEAVQRRHTRITAAAQQAVCESYAAGGITKMALARRYHLPPTTVRNILARKPVTA